ncbi:AraC family transcriptional regulator [Streptococcus halotolerans]|uniref:AraC family transcriptional regulator n=1 Tax=Streptococcus halotolerans TaxID=1814128 RepID=UPI00078706CB|nr:AraC family transcriptional regulator [Streptococcus halotolerans]
MKHEAIMADDFLPVKIIIHNEQMPANTPPHWHRSIEVNAMLEWPLSKIGVAGETFEAKTGRIWMANSMSPHFNQSLTSIGKRRAVSIQYPFHFVKSLYPDIEKGSFILNAQESFTKEQWDVYQIELFPRMEKLYSLHKDNGELYRLDVHIIILEILHILLKNFFTTKIPLSKIALSNEMVERIHAVIDYVDSYYNSDISLEDIARLLHLSRGYTAQMLKENLGMTLGEYVSFIRCQKARKDLLNLSLTQTEIAQRHGFSGLRTMNRQLVQHFGLTAKEFRAFSKVSD